MADQLFMPKPDQDLQTIHLFTLEKSKNFGNAEQFEKNMVGVFAFL